MDAAMPRRPRQGDSPLVALDAAQPTATAAEAPASAYADRPFAPPASAVEQPQSLPESFSFAHIPLSAAGQGVALQPSLRVSAPGDRFEQEADAVAAQVMRAPAATPPPVSAVGQGGAGVAATPQVEQQIGQLRGGGSPLPSGDRSFFEQRIGADFGHVRVHTGDQAAMVARQINARAFTVGSDIGFDRGEYAPGTSAGRELLAHELTHTMQQTGGVATKRVQRKAPEGASQAAEAAPPEAKAAAPEVASEQADMPDEVAGVEVAVEQKPPAGAAEAAAAAVGEPGSPVQKGLAKAAAAGPAKQIEGQQQKLQKQTEDGAAKGQQEESASEAKPNDAAGQLDAASAGGKAQLDADVAQAHGQAVDASNALAATQAEAGQAAKGVVPMAPLNMNAVLQQAGYDPTPVEEPEAKAGQAPAPDQDADSGLVSLDVEGGQAELEKIRAQAQSMVSGFMVGATGRVQGALSLGHTIPDRINAPVAAAQSAIAAGVQKQRAAISGRFAQARSDAEAKAAAQRAQIESQYSAAVASIQAGSSQALQQIDTGSQQAAQQIQQQSTGYIQSLGQRYAQAAQRCRDLGQQIGGEAMAIGETMAAGYLSQKINRSDSLLDGHLTDNRCEARAKAAREVASAYQKQLVENANAQAGQMNVGQQHDAQAFTAIVTQSTATLGQQQQALRQQIQAAAADAQQKAAQLRTSMLGSVGQSLAQTIGSLNAQEAAQLQSASTVGQQQSAAVAAVGKSTIASMQHAISETVGGLKKTLADVPNIYSQTQVPDLQKLNETLDATMAQIDGSVTALQKSIDSSMITAEQHFTQQSADALQALADVGNHAASIAASSVGSFSASMAQLQSSAKTGFHQVQESFTKTAKGIEKTASDGFAKAVKDADQSFKTVSKNIDTGLADGTTRLEKALRSSLADMRGKIQQEADAAAAKVQPRWKGIAKIALVVVVTLAVALVIGPAVIGVVGAAAGTLSFVGGTAAAIIGETVGGALAWGAASAIIQMGNNLIDGKSVLDMSVLKAFGTGALGGAIGGAVGGAVSWATAGATTLKVVVASVVGNSAVGGLNELISHGTDGHFVSALVAGAITGLLGTGAKGLIGKMQESFKREVVEKVTTVVTDVVSKAVTKLMTTDDKISVTDVIQWSLISGIKNGVKLSGKYKPTDPSAAQAAGQKPGQVADASQKWGRSFFPEGQKKIDDRKAEIDNSKKAAAPAADANAKAPDANAKAPDTSVKAPDANAKAPDANVKAPDTSAKAPDTGAKTGDTAAAPPKTSAPPPAAKVTGADIARSQNRPDAPSGYHWAKQGDDAIIKRNPGSAGTLPQLKYDKDTNDFVEVK
ncbi:DUF4157 domain-containing protein [Chloroflexia bacterium SDU3-3]|nr:DUF4157 domain-containing protein [Chloroflexia bacterium SDU3-3]